MATLINLPNELILRTLELAEPDDLENLSATCRQIRDLATNILQQHREDKRRFSQISISLLTLPAISQAARNVYTLQRERAEDHRLRLYPKRVCIDNDALSFEGLRTQEDSIWIKDTMRDVGMHQSGIFDKVSGGYIEHDEMETWRARIAEGDFQAANCLFLTLLPNVQRIGIHDGDLNNTSLCDVIERIAEGNASARRIPGTLLPLGT